MAFDLVFFGGTGDLVWRKLMPALLQAFRHGSLPEGGRILGVGREPLSDAAYRARIAAKFEQVEGDKRPSAEEFARFAALLGYVQMDLSRAEDYARLQARLAERETDTVVMYLSTAPSLFTQIAEQLREHGMNTPRTRIVLEKPLGHDLASNRAINAVVAQGFREQQVYRIDHYLGKPAVQNLFALRFGNSLFEPLWRREHIAHIQITLAEELGVEKRGAFYEDTGALRDMVQNHALQLLCAIAMEPPINAHADAIRHHRLRNEIVATKVANRIVNRMGLIHPFELAEEEGCTLGDVAEAFVIAERVYDLPHLWQQIETAEIAEGTRILLFQQLAIELRAHMADILRNAVAERSSAGAIAAYRPVIARLAEALDQLMPAESRRQTRAFGDRLLAAGAPQTIAEALVRLAELDGAIGIAALSARTGVDELVTAQAFTAVGEALGLDWAQGTAMQLDPRDPWERLLAAGLARDFQAMRLDFLARHGGTSPVDAVAKWQESSAARITAFRAMIDRARLTAAPSTAMLAQIAGQARVLLNRA